MISASSTVAIEGKRWISTIDDRIERKKKNRYVCMRKIEIKEKKKSDDCAVYVVRRKKS